MAGSDGGALITNGTATGTTRQLGGGIYLFTALGTFNGCTVNLQFLGPDGATFVTAGTNTTLTVAGAGIAFVR